MTITHSLIITLCAAPIVYTIFGKSRDKDEALE